MPQSHGGRRAKERIHESWYHADPPMELMSTSERTWRRCPWANAMATPPPKECPMTSAGSMTRTDLRKAAAQAP